MVFLAGKYSALFVENALKPIPTPVRISGYVETVLISQVEPLDRLCAHKLYGRLEEPDPVEPVSASNKRTSPTRESIF